MSMNEPFSPSEAQKLIRDALSTGCVSWSNHACREMADDDLTVVDCINVLRAGVVEEGECVSGTWRYRVRTSRIVVVVAFRSETRVVIVTAWRLR